MSECVTFLCVTVGESVSCQYVRCQWFSVCVSMKVWVSMCVCGSVVCECQWCM